MYMLGAVMSAVRSGEYAFKAKFVQG